MTNEIMTIGSKELSIIRNTKDVLDEARDAATNLQNVISKKHKPVKFNGEQYLEFEDWQTAGQFYGYTVRTGDAVSIEIDGVKGAKAKADLLDKEGRIVGGAESFCMRDEANWRSKPWFQLASMAQTRAGSKAFRNRLAWFVVLAGFKATPAEEMDQFHSGETTAVPMAAQPRPPNDPAVSMDMARLITEINEKMAAMNQGDSDAMNAHFKRITTYKAKDGTEKSLELSELPRVAQYKEAWVKGIYKKVVETYQAEFGTQVQK